MYKIPKIIAVLCFLALAATTFAKTTGNIKFQAEESAGKDLYQNNCAKCHGANGEGDKGPNLTTEKKKKKWEAAPEKLPNKIAGGGFGMPKFRERLKPEEIQAIADYVRALPTVADDE